MYRDAPELLSRAFCLGNFGEVCFLRWSGKCGKIRPYSVQIYSTTSAVVFPVLQPRLERGGMVQAGIVEDQHRGPGAGGDPGVERVDEKGGIQGPPRGRRCATPW